MGTLPLHPAMVHLPLGLAFVVPLLAVALTWALWRERLPRRAWAILVGLQAILVAGGLVALKTGEREEDRVEKIVAEGLISRHEAMAEQFVWAAAVVLILATATLLLRSGPASRASTAATTLASFVAMGLAIRVGHAGGELVYRHGAAAGYAQAGGSGAGDAVADATKAVASERSGAGQSGPDDD